MPFRRAKLTACRKVPRIYRRESVKSSRKGPENRAFRRFRRAIPRVCARVSDAAKGPPVGGPSWSFPTENPTGSLRGGEYRRRLGQLRLPLLLALLEDERVALGRDLAQAVHHRTGAGRDQAADDDVLLEAVERVDLAVDRGLGEHARGLLERRRRDERAGLQARLGDRSEE